MVSEGTYRRRLAENNIRRKARGHAGERGQARRIASMNVRQLDRLEAKLRECWDSLPHALRGFGDSGFGAGCRGSVEGLVRADRRRIDGDLALIENRRRELG